MPAHLTWLKEALKTESVQARSRQHSLSKRYQASALGSECFAASPIGQLQRSNLAPFMIHELLLSPTETASGSHPCCLVSVTYHRPSYFHGGNTGSNPVGDAKP